MHDKRTQPTKVATRSLSRTSSSNGPMRVLHDTTNLHSCSCNMTIAGAAAVLSSAVDGHRVRTAHHSTAQRGRVCLSADGAESAGRFFRDPRSNVSHVSS